MKNIICAMMHGLENALGFTRCNPLQVPDGYTVHGNFRKPTGGWSRRAKKPRHTARSHPWRRRKRGADQ